MDESEICDKLFQSYMGMRGRILDLDNFRYDMHDSCVYSSDFKKGFITGIKMVLNSHIYK